MSHSLLTTRKWRENEIDHDVIHKYLFFHINIDIILFILIWPLYLLPLLAVNKILFSTHIS